MKGLLKADFNRVRKDKLVLVMIIIAGAFAVLNPLLNALLLYAVGDSGMPEEMLTGIVSAKSLFFSCFTVGNNFGLIAPVLLAIVLCKDFSYGTIRNKIIAGKSRSAIFMSLFTTCSVVLLGAMLLNAFLTLGISLMFFDYQVDPFTGADFGHALASVGFAILSLLFVSAMLSWLCAGAKNVGVAIVLHVAISFVLVMAGGVITMVVYYMEVMGGNETALSMLQFVDRVNVTNTAAFLSNSTSFTLEDVLYLTIPSVTGIAAFVLLGLRKFNKKDLK